MATPVPTPVPITGESIRQTPPRKFEPRTIEFPKTIQDKINEYLYKNIDSLRKRWERVHKHKVVEWRRIINAEPRQKNRSFPFQDCSNLVHPLVGEAIDELVAWVLQLIYLTQPLVKFRYPDAGSDEKLAKEYADKQNALADFIDNACFDPQQLNLYPYHNRWYTDAAGMGVAHICVAPEVREEAVYVGFNPSLKKGEGAAEFDSEVLYEGPKLINCRFEDILANPDVDVFTDNDPLFRRCRLNAQKIRERVFKGHFKEDAAKKVLAQPDRHGPDETQRKKNQKEGITDTQDTTMAEWDIYEGYFSWWHNAKKHRLIAWYHMGTRTVLNCVYNFIPKNQIPIIEARLSPDKKGFAQILESFQEEVSTAKNQRNDAILLGMLGINTVDPQDTELGPNISINPALFLPVKKDHFQHYDLADPAMSGLSLQNEGAMIQQAKSRAGVDPPIGGMGAGSSDKKGRFGSQGTIAVLQTSNSRSAHRTSGFRHASVHLYSMLTDTYGYMGLGEGKVREAIEDYIKRKIKIPVRAADASMNKEVTKQNEIILNQAIAGTVKEIITMIQAMGAGTMDDNTKKWIRGVIVGRVRMLQQIIKDFQLSDNPTEFIPDLTFQEEQQPNGKPQGQQPPGLAAVAQLFSRGGGGGTPDGASGIPGAAGGPPTMGRP